MSAGDFAILIGGLLSAFGLGWSGGKALKSIRQFFETL